MRLTRNSNKAKTFPKTKAQECSWQVLQNQHFTLKSPGQHGWSLLLISDANPRGRHVSIFENGIICHVYVWAYVSVHEVTCCTCYPLQEETDRANFLPCCVATYNTSCCSWSKAVPSISWHTSLGQDIFQPPASQHRCSAMAGGVGAARRMLPQWAFSRDKLSASIAVS